MTTATRRSVLAAAVALVVLILAPTALALDTPSHTDGSPDSIADAAVEGVGSLIKNFFKAIGDFVGGIFLGFIDMVVKPFFGIFEGFFKGIGSGLQTGSQSIFADIGTSINKAYETMTDSLSGFGPLAPLVVVLVFLGIVWLFLLSVSALIRAVADNFLPEPIEKRLKDDDDE